MRRLVARSLPLFSGVPLLPVARGGGSVAVLPALPPSCEGSLTHSRHFATSGIVHRTPLLREGNGKAASAHTPSDDAPMQEGTIVLFDYDPSGKPLSCIATGDGELHDVPAEEVERAGAENFFVGTVVRFCTVARADGIGLATGIVFPQAAGGTDGAAAAAAAAGEQQRADEGRRAGKGTANDDDHDENSGVMADTDAVLEAGKKYTGRLTTRRRQSIAQIELLPEAAGDAAGAARGGKVSLPSKQLPGGVGKGSIVSFVPMPHKKHGMRRPLVMQVKLTGDAEALGKLMMEASAPVAPVAAESASNSKAAKNKNPTTTTTTAAAKKGGASVKAQLPTNPLTRFPGTIVWHHNRQFGFITRDGDKAVVYCNRRDAENAGIESGDRVSFRITQDERREGEVKAVVVRKGEPFRKADMFRALEELLSTGRSAQGLRVGTLIDIGPTRAHVLADTGVAFPLLRSHFEEQLAGGAAAWAPGRKVLWRFDGNSSVSSTISTALPTSWHSEGLLIVVPGAPELVLLHCHRTSARFVLPRASVTNSSDTALAHAHVKEHHLGAVNLAVRFTITADFAARKLRVVDIKPVAFSKGSHFVAEVVEAPAEGARSLSVKLVEQLTAPEEIATAAAESEPELGSDAAAADADGLAVVAAGEEGANSAQHGDASHAAEGPALGTEVAVPLAAVSSPVALLKKGARVQVRLRSVEKGGAPFVAYCRAIEPHDFGVSVADLGFSSPQNGSAEAQ